VSLEAGHGAKHRMRYSASMSCTSSYAHRVLPQAAGPTSSRNQPDSTWAVTHARRSPSRSRGTYPSRARPHDVAISPEAEVPAARRR
jgi:hypothetical protein